MQSGRVIPSLGAGTTRRSFSSRRSLALAAVLLAPALAAAQTFTGNSLIFPATGSNATQSQTFSITLAKASAIRSISIPLGFNGLSEFILVDQHTCTEDGTTVLAANTVCTVIVRFHPAAAGPRSASLIVTDGNGSATAFGLSGTGFYPQFAVTPAAAKIVAGQGPTAAGLTGDGDAATLATLNNPQGLATDSFGNTYIADSANNVIRMLDAFGNITTVAGGGTLTGAAAEGAAATAIQLNNPTWLAVDAAGNLYLADTGNNVVRMVAMSTTHLITTVASSLNAPQGLVVAPSGTLYIADTGNQRIVSVTAGTATTYAGTGTAGFDASSTAALSAHFNQPTGLALDSAGTLYVADTANHVVRAIAVSGQVTVFAGTGTAGNSGDAGAATSATLNTPTGLAVSPAGDVFIADSTTAVIRKVQAADGLIETIAGTAKDAGSFTPGVAPATTLRMSAPTGLAFDANANLFLADSGNNVVRQLSTAPGEISFAAQGTGVTSGPQTLRIANLGTAPLSLVSAASTSSAFTLTNISCASTVPPGAHCDYAVTTTANTYTAAEIDVTHAANNPNFNTVEPVYLTAGILTPLTIGPATLPSPVQGVAFTTTITASGGYGAITVDSEGTLPAGLTASISGTTVTLSGTPTTPGASTFTVFATDKLGATAARSYTLTVLPAVILYSLKEFIQVTDTPLELPQLTLAVAETITTTDTLTTLPSLSLTVNETITTTDAPSSIASQTITVPAIPTHTYGDANFNTLATASSGLPVTVTLVSGPVSVYGTSVSILGAGSVTLNFTQAGDATHSAAPPVQRTFTILRAAATITAASASRPFETANPAFTFTATGLVNNDTAATLGGAPSLTTTAVLNSPAGAYPITAAQGTLPAANYTYTFSPGTLTVVGQTAQTITFNKIPNVPLSVGVLTLSARSTSGLSMTYSATGPVTLSGKHLILNGTGMVTVTAYQTGDATFSPADPVTRSFLVTP